MLVVKIIQRGCLNGPYLNDEEWRERSALGVMGCFSIFQTVYFSTGFACAD